MDYLQYFFRRGIRQPLYFLSFKPCYKWITFNTIHPRMRKDLEILVLNLVINGLPSIQTSTMGVENLFARVLNLVINGLPSIQKIKLQYL